MNTVVVVLIIAMVMLFVAIFFAGIVMTGTIGSDSGSESSPKTNEVGNDTRDMPAPRKS